LGFLNGIVNESKKNRRVNSGGEVEIFPFVLPWGVFLGYNVTGRISEGAGGYFIGRMVAE
jgi:hypothetical protein